MGFPVMSELHVRISPRFPPFDCVPRGQQSCTGLHYVIRTCIHQPSDRSYSFARYLNKFIGRKPEISPWHHFDSCWKNGKTLHARCNLMKSNLDGIVVIAKNLIWCYRAFGTPLNCSTNTPPDLILLVSFWMDKLSYYLFHAYVAWAISEDE